MKTITVSDGFFAELQQIVAAQGGPATPLPTADAPLPPVPPSVSGFAMPAECAGRVQLRTEAKWDKGAGSFYAPGPLTDTNVWLIGFTVGDTSAGRLATAEYRGTASRNWVLIRNRDGVVIARGSRTQTPTISFGPPMRLVQRLSLSVGERHTFAIWNDTLGASAGMVGQFYFS